MRVLIFTESASSSFGSPAGSATVLKKILKLKIFDEMFLRINTNVTNESAIFLRNTNVTNESVIFLINTNVTNKNVIFFEKYKCDERK